jgi:hypothetical protein
MQSARPGIRVPVARGLEKRVLAVAVDHRERYPWKFPRQNARTERRELPVGDYGVFFGDKLVAAVERKSLGDVVSAVSSGTLRMQLAELSQLPRSILVVEGRLSDMVKAAREARVSTAWLLNVVAALQAEYPAVQWLFAETRGIAQNMAYRWLSAAVVVLREGFEGAGETVPWNDTQTASAVAEGHVGWDLTGQDTVPSDSGAVSVRDHVGRVREALVLAQRGSVWTARSYQEHFRVSATTAYRDLEALVQEGYLTPTKTKRPKRFVWAAEG